MRNIAQHDPGAQGQEKEMRSFGEPWVLQKTKKGWFEVRKHYGGYIATVTHDGPFAERIAECVNALAGIENPAEFIAGLIDANSEMAEMLKKEGK